MPFDAMSSHDLDEEHTRLLTYDQAYAASVDRLYSVRWLRVGLSQTIDGAGLSSDLDTAVVDPSADQLSCCAALTTLGGVVQRSLRDFLA